MRNEHLKDVTTVEQHRGATNLSLIERIPVRRNDVFDERTFQAMLALERRRAERTRQSFLLMLFDTRSVDQARAGTDFSEKLVSVVSAAVRESDVIGWYEERTVLGVVFTGVVDNSDTLFRQRLSSKILLPVRENLGEGASQLTITFHVFPERWDGGDTGEFDAKLYPDVGSGPKQKRTRLMLKRAVDILGAALFLLIHSPIFLLVAVAIKMTSRGPIIFKQERLGQFGKPFQCLKFRTMYVNNDSKIHQEYIKDFISGKPHEKKQNEAAVYKITKDPRVTSVGRFLRRTSLDEFPQFWNVLRGEMSLVGPRPPLLYEFKAYDVWHRRRILDVKPGVTGLWQVFGRSRTNFDDMVRMDVRYCQRWSLWLDLKILCVTPLAVLTGHGAY